MSKTAGYQVLAVAAIEPSANQPRKNFDPAKLQELADSIESQGVLEPILVRPRPRSGPGRPPREGRYELVSGERRWRACKLAGLDQVPAIVRTLDDRAVREIQLIENLQRDDLNPLEEARGYQELLDRDGYTVEQLAEKISRSVNYVYGVLKLNQLPDKAAKALGDGTLPKGTAQLDFLSNQDGYVGGWLLPPCQPELWRIQVFFTGRPGHEALRAMVEVAHGRRR